MPAALPLLKAAVEFMRQNETKTIPNCLSKRIAGMFIFISN
jgi:hypothetical protein